MVDDIRGRVGRFGVWYGGTPPVEVARAVERLGFGTLWLGGSPAGDLRAAEEVLEASSSLTVATGIVNIWAADRKEVAGSFARLEERHPGRFVLGVGVGHREATAEYRSPYEFLSAYVDGLLADGVPADRLVLAALGPRVLRLAGQRSAGAHPYLVPPPHTEAARRVLGPEPLLAPEQKVVIDPDPQRARAIARPVVAFYLRLSNYTANLRRLGWADPDLAGGGSDALVDGLVAHGSVDEVTARLRQHVATGADHVAVQVLTGDGDGPVMALTALADALEL